VIGLVRRLRPRLCGVGHSSHVALTFDDGPDPVSTPYFLDALAAADVRATFFVVGERLSRHRWLGRLLASAGHELAVHGWRHTPLVPGWAARRGLYRTVNLITDVTGVVPRWFRPPYGVLLPGCARLAREAGLEPVLCTTWHAMSLGLRGASYPALRGGGTLLLHDRTRAEPAWRAGLAVVPQLVALCRRRGLRVGPLAEHGLGNPPAALRALIRGPSQRAGGSRGQ
jgi:peptidoglycan/xylan/chitin deacetylase (PgdA/CDA1 family)